MTTARHNGFFENLLEPGHTTAIGSLPHHNIDSALVAAFSTTIPFLPQIPIRNPWEFMIPQTLDGLPGLSIEKEGSAVLNVDVWHGRAAQLDNQLLHAFERSSDPTSFDGFEPSASISSSWQPFLFELSERKSKAAKVQLAGPITAQWALTLNDGAKVSQHKGLANQIFKLVLAKAIAMVRRLKNDGIAPLFFFDEPGLFAFSASDPLHHLAMQELQIAVQAIRREGALVGLHCCSNTDWRQVLGLGLNFLSIDAGLSLHKLLEQPEALETFVVRGGRLSIGAIPTNTKDLEAIHHLDTREIFAGLVELLERNFSRNPVLARKLLSAAIFTPACGLALHSIADAEDLLAKLKEFRELVIRHCA